MTNHPGRKPGPAWRMAPAQLRALLADANLTQSRAAELVGVDVRTMERYLAGSRAIPPSVSGLLCLLLIVTGTPALPLVQWLHPDVAVLYTG